MSDKLTEELNSFSDLWEGGTTLAKHGWDAVSKTRNVEAIYTTCIKPFVNEDAVVLEIGCNGGGWTQKMLMAKRLIGLDALSADHTGFWRNMPKKDNIEYHHVKDFECNELDDNSIDYLFSYDVFCHISYSGAEAYLKNIYNKLKVGANCFIMIADADKYTDINGMNRLRRRAAFDNIPDFINDYDGEAKNGRWFFYGTDRFCDLLQKYGYTLIDKDVMKEKDPLSPTIHFKKEKNVKNSIVNKYSIVDSSGMTLLTPFVISKEKKVLYFHIAKTGGSTIHRILRENNYDDGVLSNKKGSYSDKLQYFKEVVEEWDSYFKFAFVRNKFDLLYSLWNYDGRPGGTFEHFITDIVANSKEQYGIWLDQYYLTAIDGKSIFDFIGRQENFGDDLKIVFDKIGDMEYNAGLHLNSAKYDHSKHFSVNYTEEMADVVRQKFKDEIDYFGFDLNENGIS